MRHLPLRSPQPRAVRTTPRTAQGEPRVIAAIPGRETANARAGSGRHGSKPQISCTLVSAGRQAWKGGGAYDIGHRVTGKSPRRELSLSLTAGRRASGPRIGDNGRRARGTPGGSIAGGSGTSRGRTTRGEGVHDESTASESCGAAGVLRPGTSRREGAAARTPPDLAVADLAVPATAAITSGHGVAHGAPEVMTPSVLDWAADRALTVKTPSRRVRPSTRWWPGPRASRRATLCRPSITWGAPSPERRSRHACAEPARGGGGGGVVGGLLGGVVGGLIGGLIAVSVCPFEILGPGCSPRDEGAGSGRGAFRSRLGGTLGAIAGQEMREIDRWGGSSS